MENILFNVLSMLKGRNFIVASNESNDEYIEINAVNEGNNMLVIIPMPNSQYSKIDNKLKDLIMKKNNKYKYAENLLIMSVKFSNATLVAKMTNIRKLINGKFPNIYVQFRSTSAFQVNISASNIVPKHEIMNKDEFENIKKNTYILDDSIPLIYEYDSPIVWLGARPDDIIRIHRMSPSSLISFYYRIVIAM